MTEPMNWEEVRQWCRDRKAESKTVVFTNGVFDILHPGHLDVLEKARALGDFLVLGLNSDTSVRRIKGDKRPIIPENQRALLLSGLKAVDQVVLFEEDTPADLIKVILPDVLVKGGDYTPDSVVGRETVEANGGRVEIVPLREGLSTTNVVETIISRYAK